MYINFFIISTFVFYKQFTANISVQNVTSFTSPPIFEKCM